MKWPADKVERRPIAKLIPAARNARTHSDEQVAQIAASIKAASYDRCPISQRTTMRTSPGRMHRLIRASPPSAIWVNPVLRDITEDIRNECCSVRGMSGNCATLCGEWH
jgi:hypothetical protein